MDTVIDDWASAPVEQVLLAKPVKSRNALVTHAPLFLAQASAGATVFPNFIPSLDMNTETRPTISPIPITGTHSFGMSASAQPKCRRVSSATRSILSSDPSNHSTYTLNHYLLIFYRANVSGIAASGDPLQGFSGFDCSQRNCPKGDNIRLRNNYGGNFEIQRVLCTLQSSWVTWFTLSLFGETSGLIYANYNHTQIKQEIEAMKGVGKVSITFPASSILNIATACSSAYNSSLGMSLIDRKCRSSTDITGGFLVQFNTELGDLSLMTVNDNSSFVKVSEYSKGTKINLECGGPTMGMCDRTEGVCKCTDNYGSSNSSNAPGTFISRRRHDDYPIVPGSRGDCGYLSKYPINDAATDSV